MVGWEVDVPTTYCSCQPELTTLSPASLLLSSFHHSSSSPTILPSRVAVCLPSPLLFAFTFHSSASSHSRLSRLPPFARWLLLHWVLPFLLLPHFRVWRWLGASVGIGSILCHMWMASSPSTPPPLWPTLIPLPPDSPSELPSVRFFASLAAHTLPSTILHFSFNGLPYHIVSGMEALIRSGKLWGTRLLRSSWQFRPSGSLTGRHSSYRCQTNTSTSPLVWVPLRGKWL